MRAAVDHDVCAGHGSCVSTCPDVFQLTADGYAVASSGDIPAELAGPVRQAARECPERAITIETE